MNQYQGLQLYLQSQRSSTGATTITIAISTDGTNYTNLGTTITVPTSFGESVISLTGISAAADVYIKLMASGASGTGTLRIDNLEIQGNQTQNAWQSSGTNIFYTTGNVGIGNNSPTSPLDVTGNLHVSGAADFGTGISISGHPALTYSAATFSSPAKFSVPGNMDINGILNVSQTVTTPTLITSHIKCSGVGADTVVHIGDSSMAFQTYFNQTNPVTGATNITLDQMRSATNHLTIGFGSSALGNFSTAMGTNVRAYGNGSIAIGIAGSRADATNSMAIGSNVKTTSSAINSIAFGSGFAGSPMVNNTINSLAIGFNSNIPTFF